MHNENTCTISPNATLIGFCSGIADDIIVNDASLENGMLQINLERIVPEEKKPRLIEVK